jgi:hypothetical protein
MIVQKLKGSLPTGPALIISLLGLLVALCCLSLVEVSKRPDFDYIRFHQERLLEAATVVTVFSCVVIALFAAARFSFGYVVGLSLFTMIAGFLWINTFSKSPYDHQLARFSAAASFLAFLALAIVAPSRAIPRFELSERGLSKALLGIEILALVTLLAASRYNFRLVSLDHIYDFRQDINFPAPIRYAISISLSALLPFAFACRMERGEAKRAVLTLLMMLLFYPITLSKLALFAPALLLWLLALVSLFEARIASILSLLLPLMAGLVLAYLTSSGQTGLTETFFKLVNFRIFAIQASALDIYNSFFSTHPHTYFCQISFLKPVMACPYDEPLSVVMQNTYSMGYMNSSMFATEGVASVGLWLAPISALVCGGVFVVANYASFGLPSRFILLSSGLMPQILTNTPLTTSLLTHGLAFLIALWWMTPRPAGEKDRA